MLEYHPGHADLVLKSQDGDQQARPRIGGLHVQVGVHADLDPDAT
jgi:hypothetical protein